MKELGKGLLLFAHDGRIDRVTFTHLCVLYPDGKSERVRVRNVVLQLATGDGHAKRDLTLQLQGHWRWASTSWLRRAAVMGMAVGAAGVMLVRFIALNMNM